MNDLNRRVILGGATAAVAGSAFGRVRLSSKKKGTGTVAKRDPNWEKKVRLQNAKWFYTWGAKAPEGIPPGVEFVPMQWGQWGCSAENMAAVKAAGHKTLLGFNEPDQKKQANMTVEKALELWPRLESTGARLGSPAGVHADGEWMIEFMKEVKKRGLRVDFITAHSYMGKNPRHFLQKMERIQKLYKKPIWITEFAVADWTANKDKPNKYSSTDVLKFMETALPKLEKLDYIERYAWFSARNIALKTSCLFNEDGSLNRLGECYAAM